MDREQKEKLMDEILEMNDLMVTTGLAIDGMAKGFIMLAFVQEAFSEIKAEAAQAKFASSIVEVVPATPPHCPYMTRLAYERQTNEWSAKCSITERSCNVGEYGLATYRDCLHYRAHEVSKQGRVEPPDLTGIKPE